ncbi:MAG: chromosomal replication initiator protein DnaA [Bacteroidaceae bacterium]|nr:chromosomal replication initiator protein DnaA [Bacteroidaceae bacterium]
MSQQAVGKWKECLDFIKSQLPAQEYDTWFGALEFVAVKGNALTISVPTKFVSEYIGKHHLELVRTALTTHFGPTFNLVWLNAEQMAEVKKREEERQRLQPQNITGAPQARPALDPHLNPHYTFANFVEGKSNKLARSVALAIAQNPGQSAFNPFFLYGPSGVGKTHLVNAIGVQLKEMHPDKRVLFVSAHVFKQQYTESVQQNKSNDFLNFYQSVEVLIIDDIQEATTPRTQQTFFHIFNHLQQNGRQIIITCDRPPALFEGIEERMLTRFKWGMIAELEKPDTALRRDILTAKVKRDGLSFPREVIQYISQNVESSVRELEGIINSIMLYSLVDNCDINLQLAARVVARAINLEKKDLTIDSITNTVAKYYGVKAKELYAKSRKQVIVKARQVAMYLAHKYTETSYVQIGRKFGGRDHSTVIHSCNLVAGRISTEKDFRHEVESIESTLKK